MNVYKVKYEYSLAISLKFLACDGHFIDEKP